MRTSLVITIASSVTIMLIIIIITLAVMLSPNAGGPKNYKKHILNSVNKEIIKKFLRHLTHIPHSAGSAIDQELSIAIETAWSFYGLNVTRLKYNVLLANPHPKIPNRISILDSTGNETFRLSYKQPPVDGFPQEGQERIFAFNAFSGREMVLSDRVVYANYGSYQDFQYLDKKNISVKGSIVIFRYGKLFQGNKVRFAEERGAKGVILYTDPAEVAPFNSSGTYPASVYAPAGAIRLGSLRLQGDLLTPGFPATDDAFSIPKDEADQPKIPVQPVGYGDAWHLLRLLDGDEAPLEWQGGLNFTYKLGPGLSNGSKLELQVTNVHTVQSVENVVGILEGAEEPDRFVFVGNHYDAWTYGGIDPSSATATHLELARIFGQMYKDRWRPRRTLVFCSWAAEEPGLIGSTEYTEQFSSSLKDRAVVYLNVDLVMKGNYSFMAMGVPLLHNIIRKMAKLVPNPDQEEVSAGHSTLYDTWVSRFPDNSSGISVAKVEPIGSSSDFRAFMYNLGIPSMDMYFTVAPGEEGLPLYHTAYETYELTTCLMDRDMLFHQASAQMWGLLAYEFATRPLLPLDVKNYVNFISNSWKEFILNYGIQLNLMDVKTESLRLSIEELQSAKTKFIKELDSANLKDPLTLRRYNDAMMLLDRALLTPQGLPGRPLLNSPSTTRPLRTFPRFPPAASYVLGQSIDSTLLCISSLLFILFWQSVVWKHL
ncbi:N-acetylated-alpha-linked acidic dipeptidase 2-like isoform X2 [Panulirus ornatus]|uniref:N-acetylated-alpha-linked acidic dipeptidase 2-like isoform X2 n=1 Tax=Panulirus ornatus TaxID=150431 RepID=UPI003A885674